MKKSEQLVEKSIYASLSAIEIYNKPDFKYREENFTILIINAWELLLKAKILKDNDEKLESLYIWDKKKKNYKKNRTKNYLTIGLIKAMEKLELPKLLKDNLKKFIEFRDTSIHFINDNELKYALHTISVANLKNYQKLMQKWFNRSLLEYNFYILPLAYSYNFQTLTPIELKKESSKSSNFIQSIKNHKSKEGDFYFSCEIKAVITTQKKKTIEIDGEIQLNNNHITKNSNQADKIFFQKVDPLKQYPISATQLYKKIKNEEPKAKQPLIWKILKSIKGKKEYSYYHFFKESDRTKYEKDGVLPKTQPRVSYNENAYSYVLQEIRKEVYK